MARAVAVVLIVGCFGLGIAACGGTTKQAQSTTTTADFNTGDTGNTGNTGAVATTTLPPATTTTAPLPPDTVTLKITGSGTANTVTILNDSNESQHNGVPIPYSTTITGVVPEVVGISAQTSDGSSGAQVGCEIDFTPGGTPINPTGGPVEVLTTNSSSGPYAVVNCTTQPRNRTGP